MKNILLLIFGLILLGFLIFSIVTITREARPIEEESTSIEESDELLFDKELWSQKQGEEYPYRIQMLNDLVNSERLKGLTEEEVEDLLGRPLRTDKNYIFYRVDETLMFNYPLHTTSLVLKLSADSTVHEVYIHK
jgi:hypothetical protein